MSSFLSCHWLQGHSIRASKQVYELQPGRLQPTRPLGSAPCGHCWTPSTCWLEERHLRPASSFLTRRVLNSFPAAGTLPLSKGLQILTAGLTKLFLTILLLSHLGLTYRPFLPQLWKKEHLGKMKDKRLWGCVCIEGRVTGVHQQQLQMLSFRNSIAT